MPNEHDYLKEMEKHLRKEKLRKARKQTPGNMKKQKPRQRHWHAYADDEWDDDGFYEDERIMPRGKHEQRKQTAKAAENVRLHADEPQEAEIDIDPDDVYLSGVVIEVAANRCQVLVNGEMLDCSYRRVMLKNQSEFTNLAAAGDDVLVSEIEAGVGVVEKILPRRNMLARIHRPDVGKVSSQRKVIAANIDRVLVVASWRKPHLWPELIDRYLIAAARNELDAVICVNKIDLVEDQAELEETIQPYRDAGYQVILTSAETGAGVAQLRELLLGATTVFAGLSGVGKSSLLSQIEPGLKLRALTVGERGKNRNQGRHTTTMATMYPLKEGGALIDTPGIREFGLADLYKEELAGFYPEIAALVGGCSYGDCTHTHEPGCKIKAAVTEGEVSEMRYENYIKILESLPG
jgi:ribosome biogenesis GTPase